MTPPKPRLLAAALLLLASATASAAPGRYGFGVEAETSGLLRPVLERVSIASVQPGSPAAAAGLRAGDRVVDIDGQTVQGAAARPMAARLRDVQAGQRLRLGVMRTTGRVVVDLVAAPRP
ncbi:PDZ domain-containing protein [Cognatilysobacter segetis]|uniref:PDZ domain-containing protein n=1 Tax=Cognatilysobacter segetis TaxID=2492394 RepID=UPI001060847F|nr:PDZ domain-containing protein [Lysobacter segetis]